MEFSVSVSNEQLSQLDSLREIRCGLEKEHFWKKGLASSVKEKGCQEEEGGRFTVQKESGQVQTLQREINNQKQRT